VERPPHRRRRLANDCGPVEAEPVTGHRLELGGRGDQGRVGGAKAKSQNRQRKPWLGWASCTSSSSRSQDPQPTPMLIGLPPWWLWPVARRASAGGAPMREQGELFGPRQGWVEVAVDLGEHAVQHQVLELLLVADVAVAPGTIPRRAARVRMVSAPTPYCAMAVSAWPTTCSRVSGGGGPSARSGLNHRVCDSRWWSVGSSRGAFTRLFTCSRS
jgi:hypothetical protein